MLEFEHVKPSPTHERTIALDLLSPFVFVPKVFDVAHLAREVADEPETLHDFRSFVPALAFVGDVRLSFDRPEISQVRLQEVDDRDPIRRQEPADGAQRCDLPLHGIEVMEGAKRDEDRAVFPAQFEGGHVGQHEAHFSPGIFQPFEA